MENDNHEVNREVSTDDILFEQLNKKKRRKRRKIIITVLALLILLGAGGAGTVWYLQKRVRTQFASETAEVLSAQAEKGRISTTVSGSGTIGYTDTEYVIVPSGVTVNEILVYRGDKVTAGTAVATVDPDTVLTALADTQSTLESLEKEINSAKSDSANTYVSSSVSGRVKAVYAQQDKSVVDIMAENGALVLISLDGKMTLTVGGTSTTGASVTVTTGGKTYAGTVESSVPGKTVVTLTDDGPIYGAEATVTDASGVNLGTGTLEIRNPLAVTGYAGIVSYVNVRENQQVYSGSSLYSLKNTQYTTSYDTLLRQRSEAEKTMNQLIALMQTGYLTAPIDGIVTSTTSEETTEGTSALSIAPDKQVILSISVDETDILSLELGQTADVTIRSASDTTYRATVTEISKIGTSSSGVTQYTAVLTMDKEDNMLSGMTASAEIQIQGSDDVVRIPVDALHQTANMSYVFTSYDKELKEYGGMVEVTVGNSNSKYVEIVSGLKEGDTVYYTEKSSNNNMFTMPSGMSGMSGNFGMPGNSSNSGNSGNRSSSNNGGGQSSGQSASNNGGGQSSGNRGG